MSKEPLSPDQLEAIECADAHANNTGLPTYTEISNALARMIAAAKAVPNLEQYDPLRHTADECAAFSRGGL
jgi:hypothetical protein